MEAALDAQKELTSAAFASSEKAILKADANSEKWMLNANEWRASMLDREERFASRTEMNAKLEALSASINHIDKTLTGMLAKGDGKHAMWGYVAAGFGFLLTLGSLAILVIKFVPTK